MAKPGAAGSARAADPGPRAPGGEAADQLQKRYRDDGCLLARVVVPPQAVSDGVFRVRIVEGFVSQVQVQGDVGPVRKRVQAYLDRLTALRPARKQDIERYLLLVTDLPGVSAVGGDQYGRGYSPSELSGDSGLGLTAELRYNGTASSPVLQAYGFYDLRLIWSRDVGHDAGALAAKAVPRLGGDRCADPDPRGLYADPECAKPLTREPIGEDDKNPRFFLKLTAQF